MRRRSTTKPSSPLALAAGTAMTLMLVLTLALVGPSIEAAADTGDEATVETRAQRSSGTFEVDTLAGGADVGDGGAATQARLSLPGGVLVDRNGDLIVVDFGNHRVRRVDHRTGVISTIAGTGEPGFSGDGGPASEAQLSRPENAALGPDGALYIVDSHNHRIRRIDPESGIITTVAGDGTPTWAGDGGPAIEGSFEQPEGIAFDLMGNCFIGDTLNGRIRRIEGCSGTLTTFAGSGGIGTSPDRTPFDEFQFLRLARLATDPEGRIIVADSPSHKIHLFDPRLGRVRTLAGTGEEGFSGDGGPAIRARLSYPEGITSDDEGNLYFADLGNHRVRRIDGITGIITTIAGTGEKGLSGDGGPALEAQLWSPGRIAVDGDDLYIADILNARVRKVDLASGTIETVVGSGDLGDDRAARDAALAVPGDLAFVPPSRLYVAEYGNRRIRSIHLDTGRITTVAGGGTGDAGQAGPSDDFLLLDDTEWATDAEIGLPEAVAAGQANDLFIADSLGHRIWRIDLGAGTSEVYAGTGRQGFSGDGGPARTASLNLPGAVTVTPDGTVWVGDFGNGRLRAIDPRTERIRTVVGAGSDSDEVDEAAPLAPASDEQPVVSLATDRGFVYWLRSGDPDVYRLDPRTSRIERFSIAIPGRGRTAGMFQLADLSVRFPKVVFADTLAHRVLLADLETGSIEVVAGTGEQGFEESDGPATTARFFRPGAVAFGPDGRIFVADTFNHRVRQLRPIPAHGISLGRISAHRLDNDFTIVVAERPGLPLVSVNLQLAIGSIDDPPGASGMAHLLEHLSLSEDHGRHLETLGAIGVNALTAVDSSQAFARLPARALEPWMEVEAARLARPIGEEARLASERRAVLREIEAVAAGGLSAPDRLLAELVDDRPNGASPFGVPAQISTISTAAVQRFLAEHYSPSAMTLAIVGDVDTSEVVAAAKRTFGTLQASRSGDLRNRRSASHDARGSLRSTASGQPPRAGLRLYDLGNASAVLAGFPHPGPHHPDAAALEALATLLSDPQISPLSDRVGGEATFGVEPLYGGERGESLFLIWIQSAETGPAHLVGALAAALSDLTSLPDGLLSAAIAGTRTQLALRLEDPASLAADLAFAQEIGGDWKRLNRRLNALAALGTQHLEQAAERHLNPELLGLQRRRSDRSPQNDEAAP